MEAYTTGGVGMGRSEDADLDRFFRVWRTHSMWTFLPKLKKSSSTWETIMRSYLPCRGRGMGRSGVSRSSVIHSGFTIIFQVQTFFPKLKNSESTQKPYGALFPHMRCRVWCDRLHPDLKWFIRVSRSFFIWKFFPQTQKFAKNARYHHDGGLFTWQSGWKWDDRLRLDLKWFIRVNSFFPNPKNSESEEP